VEVRAESGKTIELVVTESALLHPVAPADVMIGQLHRLIATIGTPSLILPVAIRLPYMLMHGYWIVDDLVTGELTVTDPDEGTTYNTVTDLLWNAPPQRATPHAGCYCGYSTPSHPRRTDQA
jgi:hypothetical protein